MGILHTFGDSHRTLANCNINTNNISNINVNIGGPYTAARFGLEKTNLINIAKNGVKENDYALFSFGEIDCRSHLCKPQIFKNYKIFSLKIIEKYIEAINENIKNYKNIKVLIFNITPPVKNIEGTYQHPEYPHIGSPEKRKEVISFFNNNLKEKCKENNFIFLDVYDDYSDINGYLNMKLSDNTVHIGDPIFIKSFLEKI